MGIMKSIEMSLSEINEKLKGLTEEKTVKVKESTKVEKAKAIIASLRERQQMYVNLCLPTDSIAPDEAQMLWEVVRMLLEEIEGAK